MGIFIKISLLTGLFQKPTGEIIMNSKNKVPEIGDIISISYRDFSMFVAVICKLISSEHEKIHIGLHIHESGEKLPSEVILDDGKWFVSNPPHCAFFQREVKIEIVKPTKRRRPK